MSERAPSPFTGITPGQSKEACIIYGPAQLTVPALMMASRAGPFPNERAFWTTPFMVMQYTMLGLLLLLTSITFAVLMPAYESTGRRASDIIEEAYPLPRCANFGR